MADCPCGLTGDNCDILIAPLSDPSFAKECRAVGTQACEVISSTVVNCLCECGISGDLCEVSNFATPLNIIIGTVIAVATFIFSHFMAAYSERRRVDSVDLYKVNFVQSRLSCVNEKTILIYRIVCFGIYVAFNVFEALNAPENFVTLTIWSWNLMGLQFLIGIILSVKAMCVHIDPTEKKGRLEYVYSVLEDVMIPVSMTVAFGFWGYIVLVDSNGVDEDELIEPVQFVFHGLNVVMLLIEFLLNDLCFIPLSVFYCLIYGGLYIIFHQYLIIYYEIVGEAPCPVYSFLDMSSQFYPLGLVALLTAEAVFYFIVYEISELKKYLTPPNTSKYLEKW